MENFLNGFCTPGNVVVNSLPSSLRSNSNKDNPFSPSAKPFSLFTKASCPENSPFKPCAKVTLPSGFLDNKSSTVPLSKYIFSYASSNAFKYALFV